MIVCEHSPPVRAFYPQARLQLAVLPGNAKDPLSCPAWVSFSSGAWAGLCAMSATYPLDLARTRQAGQVGSSRYRGLMTTLQLTAREEGLPALYRGAGVSLVAVLPFEGVKFLCFDYYSRVFATSSFSSRPGEGHEPDKGLKAGIMGETLSAGALSGLTAVLLTYPNDTVRRRMQLQGMDGAKRIYRHALHCYSHVIRHEGPRVLYRGLAVNSRITPVLLLFRLYESVFVSL
jgi:hypothetical protein